MKGPKKLVVKNIRKSFFLSKNVRIDAVKNISFTIKSGEFATLLGPSGLSISKFIFDEAKMIFQKPVNAFVGKLMGKANIISGYIVNINEKSYYPNTREDINYKVGEYVSFGFSSKNLHNLI